MFNISKECDILLYGYSKLDFAINKFDELHEAGYNVLGYIDRNAKELKKEINIPVWSLDELTGQMKEAVVILMLQNGMLHPKVAQSLHLIGFEKIIYLPENIKSYEEKMMYDRYNLFLEQDFEKMLDIPLYEELQTGQQKNIPFVCTEGIYVTKKIPVEDLYIYEKDEFSVKQPLLTETIYNGLFDYLEGKTAECKEYLSFQGATGEKAEMLLKDRRSLKAFFSKLDDEQFMIIAPHAQWNIKGYFNIIDGLHRAIYQVRNGKKEIYIRIKQEDYKKWNENR